MFDVQPQRPELIDLASRGCTVAQMALTAAELALKKAGMHNDSDLHPELLELFANGRPQQELMLTTEQYTRLRNSAPKLPYLHKTLIGRAEDAARNGDSHANAEAFSAAIQAPYANVQRGGQRDRSESAASRAERARRAGDAREEDALRGSSGFEPA
ncbi:MAG TPA: hypothetical protein VL997_08270 [Dyella sp.]|nr:hypothetical protein [Dyella sp.]